MATGEEIDVKTDVISWDDLLEKACKALFGKKARVKPSKQDEEHFFRLLFYDARNVNPREPEEICKNVVDVNKKTYCNHGGSEDETTVKIVQCVEHSESRNYIHATTKGLEWGVNANVNIGLHFGLPKVHGGIGGGPEIDGDVKGTTMDTHTKEKTKDNRVELQSHHEETVKVPPGKKVVVKITTYRVRYKLEYTMEYKIAKSTKIRVSAHDTVTAKDLLQYLPGFREEQEFVYFTQDGELRWTTDEMEVNKTIVPV